MLPGGYPAGRGLEQATAEGHLLIAVAGTHRNREYRESRFHHEWLFTIHQGLYDVTSFARAAGFEEVVSEVDSNPGCSDLHVASRLRHIVLQAVPPSMLQRYHREAQGFAHSEQPSQQQQQQQQQQRRRGGAQHMGGCGGAKRRGKGNKRG